ncbi:restriction endonuclease [Pseudoalteromonas sp. SCSIO 43210]
MFEELKNGWQWALSRFWNLFSVVGVIATFYFGLFYIPDYAKENLYSKSALAQGEILEEVGERLFAGGEMSIGEIESSIEQKEVFYKIDFPFSTKQTLLLIRNDFAKNAYIPLEKRNEINLKVQSLIEGIKDDPEKSEEWTELNYSKWISVFLAIASGLLGFLSIIQKNKKDAELEIELDEENISFEEGTVSRRGYDYSQMVSEVLKELNLTITKELKATPQQPVYGPEFEVTSSKGALLVETKAYRQKVGVNTMRGFLYMLRQAGKPGVLVSNSTLTIRAKQLLQQHNESNFDAKAHFVSGITKSDVKSGLQAIVGA